MQGAKQAPAALMRPKKEKRSLKKRLRDFRENSPYLVMIFPAVLVVFLFNYLPIYGVLIAFQDFMPGDKILSSETIWVGFENFTRFFNDVQFWPLMKNTFLLCIFGFIIGFPLPILVSLSLNALKSKRVGKVFQTIYTAPHFISLVVLPLSKAIIAVMALYYAVGQWNSYFGAMIFLQDEKKYPLQLVLKEILIASESTVGGSGETILQQYRLANQLKYVSVIVSSIPVLCLYPFVQKYFAQGVMIGSLKG